MPVAIYLVVTGLRDCKTSLAAQTRELGKRHSLFFGGGSAS